ncbi:hypothetical protein [Patulibacter sp.]|uniref:hypothetical protein n=1 Tax=Patulibacter sp. TaxID=1912859 RepID=UPI0027218F05|nr:hypothetical protein [Patulibacter sp.]MDO9409625.1 hypothetical protein [Patulibacter sp.]
MSADGAPRIDVPSSATPEEAAALVAAVEQFLSDTAVAVEEAPKVDAWARTARLEGVSRAASWDTGGHDLTAWG